MQLQSLIFEYADDSAASHADVAPLVASRSLQELQLCNAVCSDELLGVLSRTRVKKLTLHAGRFCASRKGAAAIAQQLQSLQLRVNDTDLRQFAGALPAFKELNSLTLSVHRASESCAELMQVRAALAVWQHSWGFLCGRAAQMSAAFVTGLYLQLPAHAQVFSSALLISIGGLYAGSKFTCAGTTCVGSAHLHVLLFADGLFVHRCCAFH
jgi:hypothetical protein